MPLQIQLHNRQKSQKIDKKWLETTLPKLADEILKNLGSRRPSHLLKKQIKELANNGILSVSIVSNAQIRKLNKQWRGKNSATDVLSFPLDLEPQPEMPVWEVGEVIISAEKASSQAKEYGHSFKREIAFLFVHGMLHVLGFDHETAKEEKEMFSRQREVLAAAGMKR